MVKSLDIHVNVMIVRRKKDTIHRRVRRGVDNISLERDADGRAAQRSQGPEADCLYNMETYVETR